MIKYFIIYLAIVNLLDGYITYWGIKNSWIGEMNPIMEAFIQASPLVFLMYKFGLSLLLCGLLLKLKQLKSVFIRWLLIVASVVYSLILCLHGYWVMHLLTN